MSIYVCVCIHVCMYLITTLQFITHPFPQTSVPPAGVDYEGESPPITT